MHNTIKYLEEEQLEGLTEDFNDFVHHMSNLDDTLAFWSGFVLNECIYAIHSTVFEHTKWELETENGSH